MHTIALDNPPQETMAPLDPAVFRRLLGQFATGVTVLTVKYDDEVHAATANSFTSVSLEPPLVLVCIASDGRFDRLLRASGRYCVNILGEDAEHISNRFARRRSGDHSDFADCTRETTNHGHPVLAPALAHLECRVVETVVAGDHDIFIGEVEEVVAREDLVNPLIFFRGRYRWLTSWTRTPVGDPTGFGSDYPCSL